MVGYAILAIGNAILHECGAIATVAESEGKIFPSALFVAGGSFGVVIGQTLGVYQISHYVLILPLILSEVCCLSAKTSLRKENYPVFRCVKKDRSPAVILLFAFLVTFVRSYIGYAVPISWNKEVWQHFFLFFIMGIGKALGGYLSDKIGYWKTAGDKIMVVSCIGVFFFSMTMSITFAMCLSILKNNPGMAFGITTAALFLGLVPVFFVRFDMMVNVIMITVFSLISFGMLKYSLAGASESVRNSQSNENAI